MERLPSEILNGIFIHLHLCEKMECMLVCHRWAEVIRSTSLFDTIHINTMKPFNQIDQKPYLQPSNKTLVKCLVVKKNSRWELNPLDLSEMFPSLRFIYSDDGNIVNIYSFSKDYSNDTEFSTWARNFEVCEEYKTSIFTQNLLSAGKLLGLRKLLFNASYSGFEVIDLLKNAPNITTLTLINPSIGIAELEIIHNSLLFLDSLELEDFKSTWNITERTAFPVPIITSALTTKLLITMGQTDSTQILSLLQYIQEKYINLTEFKFIYLPNNDISLSLKHNIFQDGLLPLIKASDKTLEVLDIECHSFMLCSLFEIINQDNTKLKWLKLSTRYSLRCYPVPSPISSYGYLFELTLNINSSKWIYYLGYFKTLKVLTIKSMQNFDCNSWQKQHFLHLSNIFSCFPSSLEVLRIFGFHVNSCCVPNTTYPLKKLEIHSSRILTATYSFIAKNLTQLTDLTLDYQETTSANIRLDNLNIHQLNITVMPNTSIAITTKIDGRKRIYFPKVQSYHSTVAKQPTQYQLYFSLGQTSEEETKDCKNRVEIAVDSVDFLFINDMIAH